MGAEVSCAAKAGAIAGCMQPTTVTLLDEPLPDDGAEMPDDGTNSRFSNYSSDGESTLCSSPRSPTTTSNTKTKWRPSGWSLSEVPEATSKFPSEGSDTTASAKFDAGLRRQAVSASPVRTSALDRFKKPFHEKDPATRDSILRLISESPALDVISTLQDQQLEDVVNALRLETFALGDDIVQQGDGGERLYIIEEGSADVFVTTDVCDMGDDVGGKGIKVNRLDAGSVFGELAFLYNSQRAATVTAASPEVSVWVLDAEDFKMLMIQDRRAEYGKYEGWLKGVELFEGLSGNELSRLADTLRVHRFREGAHVVRQGDFSDRFFMLVEGSLGAYIDSNDGEKEVKIYQDQGDHFGEAGLLQVAESDTTIRCLQDSVVVWISKSRFEKMLGPTHEKLKPISI